MGSVASNPTIAINAACYLDDGGTAGSAELSVGDIEVELESITHAEDAAHASGDDGIMPLAVRNDTLAALAGTDGDYAPLQVDAAGALYSRLDAVTGTDGAAGPAEVLSVGGTQATGEIEELRVDGDGHPQVDVLTSPTSAATIVDDAAFTPATDSVVMAGAELTNHPV